MDFYPSQIFVKGAETTMPGQFAESNDNKTNLWNHPPTTKMLDISGSKLNS